MIDLIQIAAVCTIHYTAPASAPCIVMYDDGVVAFATEDGESALIFLGELEGDTLVVTHIATHGTTAPYKLDEPGYCRTSELRLFCRVTLGPKGQVITAEAIR